MHVKRWELMGIGEIIGLALTIICSYGIGYLNGHDHKDKK